MLIVSICKKSWWPMGINLKNFLEINTTERGHKWSFRFGQHVKVLTHILGTSPSGNELCVWTSELGACTWNRYYTKITRFFNINYIPTIYNGGVLALLGGLAQIFLTNIPRAPRTFRSHDYNKIWIVLDIYVFQYLYDTIINDPDYLNGENCLDVRLVYIKKSFRSLFKSSYTWKITKKWTYASVRSEVERNQKLHSCIKAQVK